MIRHFANRVRVATLILSCVGLVLAAPNVHAQGYGLPGETPSSALARHVRVLASTPKNFAALVGAGKAALAMGDTQAAAGFFARADEVFPTSPVPQIGMGATTVQNGDASGSLVYFARAQQLGATVASFGAERGLAYDLLGRTSDAQNDYRLALAGPDADEARRRLALSLAIAGNKAEAINTLGPLMARGDSAAARVRALVLAVTGDTEGARRSIETAMPGSSSSMAPFLARLPGLRADQKAAAVHLGIFPDGAQPAYGYGSSTQMATATPTAPQPAPSYGGTTATATNPVTGDRLTSVEQLLRTPQPYRAPPASSQPSQQLANVVPMTNQQLQTARTNSVSAAQQGVSYKRFWVQLASGPNAAAFPDQFRRIKSRHRDLLDGISGYIANDRDRARLLIGPFRNAADAGVFAEDLESQRVDAFSWTSPEGMAIRKLNIE